MRHRFPARLTLLALATAAVLAAQTAGGPLLVLNDVNLIDGSGAAAKPHQRIVIRGERIEAAGDARSEALPPGAVIWNLHGMTVIPG